MGIASGNGVIAVPMFGIPEYGAIPDDGVPKLCPCTLPPPNNPAAHTSPAKAIFRRESFMSESSPRKEPEKWTDFAIDPPVRIHLQEGEAACRRTDRRAPRPSDDFDEVPAARTLKSVVTVEYPEFVICAKSG
jgi:hypothetical protein